MYTNKNYLKFNFNGKDIKLFEEAQKEHWSKIEREYKKLKSRCKKEILLPIEATHKNWISARVNKHVNVSIMRLLYLTEAFCETSKKFNGPASATLIKSMIEVPLHMGYVLWILSENHSFEVIKKELEKITFGDLDKETGLTHRGRVSGRDMYEKSDKMMEKVFAKETYQSSLKVFETIYKESNATGHNNFEALMFCGLQNGETWKVKDRKEIFKFLTNKIFQLFLHCHIILGMTSILCNFIDQKLEQLPDYLET